MNTTTFSRRSGFWISGLLIGLASAAAVQATELVYTPVNPSFGGNPLNGTWLLNNAQAQNDHDDPDLKKRSTVAGTSKIASQAEYDAGAQLINLKEWPRAIQVLEHFRTRLVEVAP